MDTDRNLLFGVLAVQFNAIGADQLRDAYTAWTMHKDVPFADGLVDRGLITAEDRVLIDELVQLGLRKHNDDAAATLAAFADNVTQDLQTRGRDTSPEHTQAHQSSPAGHVLLSTLSHEAGSRERYSLTRLHAQGGIGRVWLARDAEMGRDVALKELRPERTGNPAIWARFLEEARVTGQLEHPGIVPVYELSKQGDERNPFYTMRFVRGRTLTEAVRAYHKKRQENLVGPLDLQFLLSSFIGICNAIAYAHSRGVIHRDLKGQNVVLGDFGEVMVLDWGLAKVIGQGDKPIPEGELPGVKPFGHDPTMQGQVLGTPGYMPPEQAGGQLERVNERSDVYGLGAILYDILTNRPPFVGENTNDVLHRVIHENPVPPRQANPQAPAALEAICLKSIAKQPENRYASPSELADDIKRFLADEPVSVYREPLSIRITRWGRRHRTVAASVAVLFITALVGLSIGTVLINGERAKAEANFRQARAAVDEYFTTVSESKLLDVPGLQPLRKELLDAAQKYYQDFLQKRANDLGVRAEAASASFRVGWINHSLGRVVEATQPFQTATRIYEALSLANPDNREYRHQVATCYGALGLLFADLGRNDEAMQSHQKALVIREDLLKTSPADVRTQNDVSRTHRNIGNVHRAAGKPAAALAEWKTAIAIGETLVKSPLPQDNRPVDLTGRNNLSVMVRSDLASVQLDRAEVLREGGNLSEAQNAWSKARDAFEVLRRERPADLVIQNRLASVYIAGSMLQIERGQIIEAYQELMRGLALHQELADANPSVVAYRVTLAETKFEVGWVLAQLDREAEALEMFRKSIAETERVLANDSEHPGIQNLLARALTQCGNLLVKHRQLSEALPMLERALQIHEAISRDEPESIAHKLALANALRGLGRAEAVAVRPASALGAFQRARDLDRSGVEMYPGTRYNLACDLALMIPVAAPDQREDLAKQAIVELRRAFVNGYANVTSLKKDTDFDSLRTRSDFQSLLADVQAKVSTNK